MFSVKPSINNYIIKSILSRTIIYKLILFSNYVIMTKTFKYCGAIIISSERGNKR